MKDHPDFQDRHPAVAGQFYPARPDQLQHALQDLFAQALPRRYRNVRAVISPHAGYVFSGTVAASTFNQIDGDKAYRHIFVLASSHHENLHGAAVYCHGDYIMPFGRVNVDTAFSKRLVDEHPDLFFDNPRPHVPEHGIEVQLPFLNYVMDEEYRIVPILLGAPDHHLCERIADVLRPYFNEKNLFVVSTDFCHYPDYTDARRVDDETKDAILSNNPDTLRQTLRKHVGEHVPGLVTSLCGWTSVLTLLYLTQADATVEYRPVAYLNSGDTPHMEDTDRVVGYWGIVVCTRP